MSTLELRWADRKVGTAQRPRRFLDFVVDGQSLYEKFGDHISPLGWGDAEENRAAVHRFLRKSEPDLPHGRTSIYICPQCRELDCGAVSAVIERKGQEIVWRDFGYQNTFNEDVNFEGLREIGPFSFNATEYFQVFRTVLNANGR